MKKFTFWSLVLALCMSFTSVAIAQQAPESNNAPVAAVKTTDDGINWWWVGGFFILIGLSSGAYMNRDDLGDVMGTSPTTGDWYCTVDTCQRMGQYGLLMTGVDGKSYTLEIGALIASGKLASPGKWRDAMDEIGTGSELCFLVRASDIMESRTAAIPIMRLNSYTKKTLHYGQDY